MGHFAIGYYCSTYYSTTLGSELRDIEVNKLGPITFVGYSVKWLNREIQICAFDNLNSSQYVDVDDDADDDVNVYAFSLI